MLNVLLNYNDHCIEIDFFESSIDAFIKFIVLGCSLVRKNNILTNKDNKITIIL